MAPLPDRAAGRRVIDDQPTSAAGHGQHRPVGLRAATVVADARVIDVSVT